MTLVKPSETDHHSWQVALVQKEPLLVDKISKATGLSDEESGQMIVEVLRFLHLIAYSKQKLTPPHVLDLAWHECILFTRSYAQFCEDKLGSFIHHQPGGTESENRGQLKSTLKLYALHFGPPPVKYWGDHGYFSEAIQCGACEG